ncbi:MAG TPA: type IV pilin [Candidatus Thermoplasmatota archaeon]|nr:type IV pilin [Candidatus Thermoplasmatota archaeon]
MRKVSNDDDAVSPVIAVILMVAITVVLAATVYIWVTSFSSQQDAGVQASVQATSLNRTGSGAQQDTIRILLSNAADAPFPENQVSVTVNGASATAYTNQAMTTTLASAGQWGNGGALYVACTPGGGNHNLVVTIRGSVVLAQSVRC